LSSNPVQKKKEIESRLEEKREIKKRTILGRESSRRR
jgi:hypothetical protein